MRRGGGGRPDGSDGSDFTYRMTVDDRYKRAAQGKITLRKYITAQTVFQLLKGSMAIFALAGGETVETLQVLACIFGVLSVITGTLGLKQGGSNLLKTYIFFMSLTVGLSLVPFVMGKFYEKMTFLTMYRDSKDYWKLAQLITEGVQDIIGIIVGIAGISVAANLLEHVSPPRKKER